MNGLLPLKVKTGSLRKFYVKIAITERTSFFDESKKTCKSCKIVTNCQTDLIVSSNTLQTVLKYLGVYYIGILVYWNVMFFDNICKVFIM